MNGSASFQLGLTVTEAQLNSGSEQIRVTNTGFGESLA
jgi:hypothetical protein